MATEFEFDFDAKFMPMLAGMGVFPKTSGVTLTDEGTLVARFGLVKFETPIENITSASLTGPYNWVRAIGTRFSFSDRGITFGSNAAVGVCICLESPERTTPPVFAVRHPNITVTVKEPRSLIAEIDARIGSVDEERFKDD